MPGAVFICTRGQRNAPCSVPGCSQRHQFLCDWKLKGEKAGKTCDKKLCAKHARQVAKDKHLCPAHANEWATHPKNPNRQGTLAP